MISSSSVYNNNKKPDICATVCNVLCVQRSVARFKGSVNALQKCCASVARHLRVRLCVCVRVCVPTYGQCQAAVAATASQRRFAMQMPGKWRLLTVNGRLATRLRSMLHAACWLLSATCHLPPAAPPRDCVCVTFGRKVQATSSSDVSAGPASTRAQQFVSLRLSSLVQSSRNYDYNNHNYEL